MHLPRMPPRAPFIPDRRIRDALLSPQRAACARFCEPVPPTFHGIGEGGKKRLGDVLDGRTLDPDISPGTTVVRKVPTGSKTRERKSVGQVNSCACEGEREKERRGKLSSDILRFFFLEMLYVSCILSFAWNILHPSVGTLKQKL